MTQVIIQSVTDLISYNEGLTLVARPDTNGKWEIGYGHDGAAPGDECTLQEAQAWRDADIVIATRGAELDLGTVAWAGLDIIRQGALTDMAYELGVLGEAGFTETLAAIRDRDWVSAQKCALESDWYKQVPARAERDAGMLLTGLWPIIES